MATLTEAWAGALVRSVVRVNDGSGKVVHGRCPAVRGTVAIRPWQGLGLADSVDAGVLGVGELIS